MIVITKRKAMKMITDSLFTKGGTLNKSSLPFCTGKYNNMLGQEVVDIEGIAAVYQESRRDKDGQYYKLLSVEV